MAGQGAEQAAGRGAERIRDVPEEWEVRTSQTSFAGRIWDIRTDEVVMPDGAVAARDYQQHPGAVGVLALDEQRRVLLVRQYRHPVRHRLWELPAGLLDVPGENPLHAAQRELYEEAYTKAGDWRVLIDFYASPGGSSEALRIFLAQDLADADGARFEAEHEELDLQVDRVDLDELVRLVLAGELHNGALVSAVLAARVALDGPGLDGLRPAGAPWPARPFE
ncbi:NUDIX hydrolase [Streptacidiphilus sp. PB12-B1b]|uniref:NUDIX domain-containing protein n=1 Tax=Streptacidiphilus sp. PB12-B1b TaxID=2705012 RepID=UPI0015FDEBF9|nr:NUDIX hydrolase [Streptacidiphilus sp. PB12-B1b]QMU78476.1 NUDIX hydrolase [Streptacidiphilus sp. PB12-B1b]